jgi:two-component system, LytTR family, sensor kinase
MSRTWVAVQLAIAWLPMWAIFTVLMMSAHGRSFPQAALGALPVITAAALLAIPVYRLTRRWQWPHPFRPSFIFMHIAAAVVYGLCWIGLISLIESAVEGQLVIVMGPGFGPFVITGMWLYFVVGGVSYANQAVQRAAQLEALAARSQLAALRSQLQPHFLFNALHTVVQLIPTDPRAASRAAEQLAQSLRATIDEERDVVSLGEEWALVDRYLAIERIRLGDRLVVDMDIDEQAMEASLPSFALQSLVENAVRHGAGPRLAPTHVAISARVAASELRVTVSDDGAGATESDIAGGKGSGLRRLRERMQALYGADAKLDVVTTLAGGFKASLTLPQGVHD